MPQELNYTKKKKEKKKVVMPLRQKPPRAPSFLKGDLFFTF